MAKAGDEGGDEEGFPRHPKAEEQAGDQRGEQGGDGLEKKGMGEVPVIFNAKEAVAGGTDENVGIRQQARDDTCERCRPAQTGPRHGERAAGTEGGVGERIHLASLLTPAASRLQGPGSEKTGSARLPEAPPFRESSHRVDAAAYRFLWDELEFVVGNVVIWHPE